jgi:CheY-like chemotaxis protein
MMLLPSAEQSASAEQSQEMPADEMPGSVRSVLLVDDDEMVRTVLGEQLRDLGLQVVEAPGGLEALDILSIAPERFDLLLTDYAMPHFNGLQTIDRIRGLDPDIRVAIMTGYMDARLEAKGDGIDVLQKPVSVRDLAKILR